MEIDYKKLMAGLKAKKFEPVYFLQGEENYFIDEISDYIEKNALSESEKSFNQQVLYGKDIDAATISSAARRYPLMSSHQVLIIKEAQNIKSWEALESYFEKPVDSTILVIAHKYKSLDKRLKLYKSLKSSSYIALFDSKKLDEKKVPEMINEYLAKENKKINARASQILTEYLGNDLEKIVNALNKLMSTKIGDEPIDEKDIEQNVGISREYNIYELQKALLNKDLPRLAKITDYMSSHLKDNPLPMMIGFLYTVFSKLAAVQLKGAPANEIGLNDWYYKDYLKYSATYPGKSLQLMSILHEYDLKSKGVNSTGSSEGELMKEMIYRIVYC